MILRGRDGTNFNYDTQNEREREKSTMRAPKEKDGESAKSIGEREKFGLTCKGGIVVVDLVEGLLFLCCIRTYIFKLFFFFL